MYYLLNQNNQVVAADDSLLSVCAVSDIDTLFSKMLSKQITFTPLEDDKVMINNGQSSTTYRTERTPLSFLLGKIDVVTLTPEDKAESKDTTLTEALLSTDDNFTFKLESDQGDDLTVASESLHMLDLDDEDILEILPVQENTVEDTTSDDTLDILSGDLDDETLSLLYPEGNKEEPLLTFNTPDEKEEESELFSLKTDEDDHDTSAHTKLFDFEESVKEEEETPPPLPSSYLSANADATQDILINVAHVSRKIGVSETDYRLFLNEYIDTALASEEKLKSNDPQQQAHSMNTLSHLAEVLHLPMVGEIISKIDKSSGKVQSEMINAFYTTLSKISIEETKKEETKTETILTKEPKTDVSSKGMSRIAQILEESTQVSHETELVDLPPFNLDDVKPIHFDFLLEEAATDLSLPVALIEEFVLDFIAQAKEETPKMLSAYHKGDIQSVHKIGHLLKGASSNLRIVPLADTLYEIQFCQDPSKLSAYIKDYWGHFLSFEKQINMAKK